jgi:hypothetical protein
MRMTSSHAARHLNTRAITVVPNCAVALFVFKSITQVYYIYIYMLWIRNDFYVYFIYLFVRFVAHPITEYIYVPGVSFLSQVVLASSGSRLVQRRGLSEVSSHGHAAD